MILTRNVIFDEERFPFKEGNFLGNSPNKEPSVSALPTIPSIALLPRPLTRKQPPTPHQNQSAPSQPPTLHPQPQSTQQAILQVDSQEQKLRSQHQQGCSSSQGPSTTLPILTTAHSNTPILVPISYLEIVPSALPNEVPSYANTTNNHPMMTRSKHGIFKSRVMQATVEPRNVKEALAHPKWK